MFPWANIFVFIANFGFLKWNFIDTMNLSSKTVFPSKLTLRAECVIFSCDCMIFVLIPH